MVRIETLKVCKVLNFKQHYLNKFKFKVEDGVDSENISMSFITSEIILTVY